MSWLALALVAPIMWGMQAVILRIARTRSIPSGNAYIFFAAVAGIMGFVAMPFYGFSISLISAAYAVAAGVLGFLWYWIYVWAFGHEEPSRIVTAFRINAVFVLVLSILVLGESLDWMQSFAFVLIFLGSLLISVRKSGSGFSFSKPVIAIVGAALIFSFTVIFAKFAMEGADPYSVFAVRQAAFFSCGMMMLANNKFRVGIKESLGNIRVRGVLVIAAIEMIGLIGLFSQISALENGPASLIVLMEGFIPFVVLAISMAIGWRWPFLIREEIRGRALAMKIVAIVIMFAGLYMLS